MLKSPSQVVDSIFYRREIKKTLISDEISHKHTSLLTFRSAMREKDRQLKSHLGTAR